MLTIIFVSVLGQEVLVRRGFTLLSPPEPLPLGGYSARGGKPEEPGGEGLYARTTLIAHAGQTWAIVTLDMLTVPESLVREVQKRVPYKLFLIATHTHSAPDSQMLNDRMTFSIPGIASFKSRWLDWYAERISSAIQLVAKKPPTSLTGLFVRQSHLPLNRGRRVGALPDDTGTLVTYQNPDGTPRNLWFHFAAHAVFWGPERNQKSADWPGAVAEGLKADVLTGAIGDVSPRTPETLSLPKGEGRGCSCRGVRVKSWLPLYPSKDTAKATPHPQPFSPGKGEGSPDDAAPQDRIAYFLKVVQERFSSGSFRSLGSAPVRWVQTPIALGPIKAHPEFAKANRIPDPLAQSLAEKFAPREAHITAFRIGKLAVVGIPGEPTSHLGRQIRDYGRRIGFNTVLVCSHVNGWIGYVLSAEDYARGGYEATLAMHGPGQGEAVVRAGCEALRALAE